jgi:hypothetical protein
MNIPIPTRRALGIVAGAAMVSACSGVSSTSLNPPVPQPAVRSHSWVLPEAKHAKALVYVTDGSDDDAYILTYPKGKLVGTLTGLNDPNGMCADSKGDVYITENYGQQVLEYAHGGAAPIATLNDPGWQPNGCSVDPSSGDVAVANIVTTYFGEGSLAIYPKGSSSASYYTPPGSWFSVNAVGYDNKGNVMIAGSDGFEGGQNFETGELPNGSSGIENTTLSNESSFGNPGNVQWDGKYITFADANTGIVYRYTFSGTTGTEVSSTQVSGCCSGQVWYSTINGKVLLEGQGSAEAYAYKYPAGGKVTDTFDVSPANCAILSVAKKK